MLLVHLINGSPSKLKMELINFSKKYKGTILNVFLAILLILIHNFAPHFASERAFRESPIPILLFIILILELPAIIIKASALWNDPDFDGDTFNRYSENGFIYLGFCFKTAFAMALFFSAMSGFLEEDFFRSIASTLAITVFVKEILSAFFSLTPIKIFDPKEYLHWGADIILTLQAAIYLSFLQIFFGAPDMRIRAGVFLSWENIGGILFAFSLFGIMILGVHHSIRLLYLMQELNQMESKQDRIIFRFSMFILVLLTLYPIFYY